MLPDEGKFDALAHGVDSFGADADFVAEVPLELAGFCATAGSRRHFAGAANEVRTW
jgi:hypothetical protein